MVFLMMRKRSVYFVCRNCFSEVQRWCVHRFDVGILSGPILPCPIHVQYCCFLSCRVVYTVLYLNLILQGFYVYLQIDPMLDNHRSEIIKSAARALDKAKMIRFDVRTSYLSPIDVGRIASHFYIKYDTIEVRYIPYNYKVQILTKLSLIYSR